MVAGSVRSARPLVAFVLGGGGSWGATQAGMLLALAEAGITPGLVVGSSVGALNGALFAGSGDVQAAQRLHAIWRGVRRRDIFPVGIGPILAALTGRRDGLLATDALGRFINRNLPFVSLQDAPIPFHAVATDAASGATVVLSHGDAGTALKASCAIPGLFPPVERDGRVLFDGSIAADLALGVAANLGATTIYAMPSARTATTRPRGALAVALRAADQLIERGNSQQLQYAAHVVTHVLPAPVTTVATVDFSATEALLRAGYDIASQWLQSQDQTETEASNLSSVYPATVSA